MRVSTGGLRTFNIEEEGSREQEIDGWAGYRFPLGVLEADLGVITYQFPRGDRFDPESGFLARGTENDRDFTEFYAKLAFRRLTAGYYRAEDYFGSGEVAHYHFIDYRHEFAPELHLGLHYGLKDSDAVPDHDGTVFDWAASLGFAPFRVTLSNLDDNEDARQSDNPRLTVYWQRDLSF